MPELTPEDMKRLNDALYKGPPQSPFSSGIAPSSGGRLKFEVLSESATGDDNQYTLTYHPVNFDCLLIFLDGIHQSGFSLTGAVVDFGDKVPQGVRVEAWYIY